MGEKLQDFISNVAANAVFYLIVALMGGGISGAVAVWVQSLTEFEQGIAYTVSGVFLLFAALFGFLIFRSEEKKKASERHHVDPPRSSSLVDPPGSSSLVDPPGSSSPRITAPVGPEFIWKQFEGRTHDQAQKLVEVYIGQWLQVVGILQNLRSGTATLSPNPQVMGKFLLNFSDQADLARLSGMPLGERLSVFGRIKSIEAYWIMLSDCELLSSGASLDASPS